MMQADARNRTAAFGKKAKCFGNQAALTVEATALLMKGEPVGSTVNLELARRVADGFDWSDKIQFQLSEDELAAFACVLLGYLPRFHFKRPSKGIEVERQTDKLFVRGTAGTGKIFALPLTAGRVFAVSTLVIGQLQSHFDCTDTQVVLASLRGAAALSRNQ
tara:strand:- start:27702 stop:28187 length:486 start_codon:yes stop_codon:yes gene_type:complete